MLSCPGRAPIATSSAGMSGRGRLMVALYRRNGELSDQRPSATATATRPDRTDPAAPTGPAVSIQDVVEQRLVSAEFQSIHRLDTTEPVGFEAFARGPAGELNNPGKLFGAAAAAGLSVELDQVAHAAAYRAALMGKLNPSQ